MTPKTKKILLTTGAIVGGGLAVLVVVALLVLNSSWFSNFAREKIVSAIEDSTGGKVDIGSFQLDLSGLTVRIRNLVLHGTEPANSAPLFRVNLIELHLKLFSSFKKVYELQYLGVDTPQADVVVFPNGKTNIPTPKTPSKPSNTSGLETIVDLAVNKFDITNGLLQFRDQKAPLNVRGENLRAQLLYNMINPSYRGSLSLDPLLQSGDRPALRVHVSLPVTIEKDAIRIANATLTTAQSNITINGDLQNMKAPVVNASVNATVSLPEVDHTVGAGLNTNARGVPQNLTLSAKLHMDPQRMELQTANLALGQTTFQASGVLRDASHQNSSAQFNGHLALAQLSELLKIKQPQAAGAIDINGNARLDAQSNYYVDGQIHSAGLSLRSGTTRLSNVSLNSPFHADPYLISLDGLRLNVLGGSLDAKIFVAKMQQLSVEGNLHNFNLQELTLVTEGKRIGYDGTLSGTLKAQGDLKATGTTGYAAQAHLRIAPGSRGVPVNGRIDADYRGANGAIDLGQSFIALPNSRLDLSGSLNHRLDVTLTSHNLNDFLPAANFTSKQPQSSLPVTLQGGTAQIKAQVDGTLSTPHITGNVSLTNFAVEQRSFDRLSLDLAASPSGAKIDNGVLARQALQTTFDASIGLSKWSPVPRSPVSADLSMRNGSVADLLSMAGESSIPASGDMSADVHVNGTYGNPLGSATVQVLNGNAYQQPFDRFYTKINLGDRLITLDTLELTSGAARVDVNGTYQHPADSFTVGHVQAHVATQNVQLANFQALQRQSPGLAGLIQLTADASADLREVNKQSQVTIANVNADLSARGLRIQNQDAGELTATARTDNGAVRYNVASNFAGSNVLVNGTTALTNDYATNAQASIQNLSVEKALSLAGQSSIPARGTFSADAKVSGTLQRPNASLNFLLANANVYHEPLNRFGGSVQYSDTLVSIPSLEVQAPAGSITLSGSFSHPANDLKDGAVQLHVNSSGVQLAKIATLQQQNMGIAGTLQVAADLAANLRDQNGKQQVLFQNVNANLSAAALRMNSQALGDASFKAQTTGSNLHFTLDSDLAKSSLHGQGDAQLTGDYPVRADLTFANIKYSNIAPFLAKANAPAAPPQFEALVEGEASVNGPVLNTDNLTAKLQINRLEANNIPNGTPTGAPAGRSVTIHNEGPIIVGLNHMVLAIQQARLQGSDTSLNASGQVNLKNSSAPLNLALTANVNLGILQDLDRDIYSSGGIDLNARVRGSFAQPLLNGRVELKNANINMAEAPNGLSNGNGVILLNGTSATIQNLTGESGGGKVQATGFIGLTGTGVTYNVHLAATRIRTRYSGVSITSSAALALTGNTQHSVLDGRITLQRIAYGSSSDAGSLLSGASAPVSTPTAPSGILSGMKLDISVVTAPGLRVVSTYAQRLHVLSDLTIRGTAAQPGIVGRIAVTDGELVFFGNEYRVNTGTITFFDPTRINPVLNVSIETTAQGVDVTLNLQGPMDNLKLTYTSDPPITFQEIVELLAANTTPTSDPTIAANQPTPPQQSMSQMGESAVVGQAVATPLANRLQRVFGVSQLKIDPTFAGNSGLPTARVTLQQQVTTNVTFTYITDVSATNDQIIRVEWAMTPKFSAIALRDEYGVVGVDFVYKGKLR
ncbi:MAG TPA: translocation/assembly module TamB domain-containing protein [Bryobacteraceae bacterium]|jgi:translocation and assembly module TamB|nr:translocation/assembly module TamB domain-containing protein [Bryobacteraceae bacterium]